MNFFFFNRQLTPWVQILKARFNLLSSSSILPLSESPNSWGNQQQRLSKEPAANATHCNPPPPPPQQQVRVRRSNSLTPPVSLCQSTELWTSQVSENFSSLHYGDNAPPTP